MNLRLYTMIAAWFGVCVISAQAPWTIEWQRAIGTSVNDIGQAVHQTSDGGYIVGGYSGGSDGDLIAPHGGRDMRLIKLDAMGSIEWQVVLGGSLDEQLAEVRETPDDGYLVVGSTQSDDGDVVGFHGAQDAWVVKLDATGTLQWQRALGGSLDDQGFAMDLTSDGGCVVAGVTSSDDGDVMGAMGNIDAWVVKLDGSGTISWQHALGGSDQDRAFSIRSTADGGSIFTGQTRSTDGDVTGAHGFEDLWVVKLDAMGGLQWQRPLGGTSLDVGLCVRQTSNGGYAVAGYTYSNDGDVGVNQGSRDYWVTILDPDGDLELERTMGGPFEDTGSNVCQTNDGGYLIGGNTLSNSGDVSGNHGSLNDIWLVQLAGDGAIQWQLCLGGTGSDVARMVSLTGDGGAIVIGNTQSNDGDVSGNHGGSDIWVVKLRDISTSVATAPTAPSSLIVVSGPAATEFTISYAAMPHATAITITDMSGRAIMRHALTGSPCVLSLGALTTGCYLATVIGEQGPISQRFVR